MGIGTLVLIALSIGEIVSLMKIKKQSKRIKDLEEKTGIVTKK